MEKELYGKKVLLQIAFGATIGATGGFSIKGIVTSLTAMGGENFLCIDKTRYINIKYIVAIEEI